MKYQLISSKNEILFEGKSLDPIEDLYKFKRKTFGDVYDREFRQSILREHLKSICNHGGEITIKLIKEIN